MILVTSYTNPDLDGTACTFAYSEFLNKTRKEAIAGIFGTPDKEAKFVMDKFCIGRMKDANKIIKKCDDIILVDASELSGISNFIEPSKVSEIIDHRKINQSDKFQNARIQIDFVGSAATLIAEKFYNLKVEMSKESAALLASAIVSNTINFKANVTTKRDKNMYEWLLTKVKFSKNYTHDMFVYKSEIDKPLKKFFLEDKFAVWDFGGTKISIVQIEIVDLENFIDKNITKINKVLLEIKNERQIDAIFLTSIDIEKGFNIFVVIDEMSRKILSEALKIKFKGLTARREGIIMRKEIVPLVKDVMS